VGEFPGPAIGFPFDNGALHDLPNGSRSTGPAADNVARFRLNADDQGDVACGWTASAEAASAVLELEYGMHEKQSDRSNLDIYTPRVYQVEKSFGVLAQRFAKAFRVEVVGL
jgi:hypothetical protein